MTNLANTLNEYGARAYLLTCSANGPHTSFVDVALSDGELQFYLSRTAQKNVTTNPNVSLLWPPTAPGGYGMIVNGVVRRENPLGERSSMTITKSVLHRPGRAQIPDSPCESDCKMLALG